MRNDSVTRSFQHKTGWKTFLCCVYLLMTCVPLSYADDASDKADNLLDNLKRRSAEERWQRVKKLYPADPPAPRKKTPSRLPTDNQQVLPDDELPPSPEQAPLIPRLTAIPQDDANDWILPVRQPIQESESGVTGIDDVPSPSKTTIRETRSPLATVRVAVQDVETPANGAEKVDSIPTRALRERRMSEINPYYDRDRDGDIREFAIEKGKEVDILFRPKTYTERSFPEITLAWEASNFTYYPLYFSDPALERYGHSYHPLVQPIASIARVGAQFVMLPYQMTILPPCKEESALGYYRPGECTPKLLYQVPLNAQAALVEAGAISGIYFIIP